MRNKEFKTKKEYIQYRKDWKIEYKQLSQTIREKRYLIQTYTRAFSKAELDKYDWYWRNKQTTKLKYFDIILSENLKYQELKKKHDKGEKWIGHYQKEATTMLDELKESKLEAQRQYLVSRKEMVAA